MVTTWPFSCMEFRPWLTSVLVGEHASSQQVRRVPQTCSRMVAVSSSRNLGRRIRLSGGQVNRHLKTRKVPCVRHVMSLLQVNQSPQLWSRDQHTLSRVGRFGVTLQCGSSRKFLYAWICGMAEFAVPDAEPRRLGGSSEHESYRVAV